MKVLCVLLMVVLLCGCAAQPTLEQVNDPWVEVAANAGELEIRLPQEAAAPALYSPETGELYFCDGYVLMVQTFCGGDLDATMRQITGYAKDRLSYMETRNGNVDQYSCVWSSAGESGDQVGRCLILDDGSYHYTVTVMAEAETAGELAQTWQDLFGSVRLTGTD